jgi:hypothetical protein
LDLFAAVVVGPPFYGTDIFGDYAAFYELTAPTPQGLMVAERIAIVFVIQFQPGVPRLIRKAVNIGESRNKASKLFGVDLDIYAEAAIEDFSKAFFWRLWLG